MIRKLVIFLICFLHMLSMVFADALLAVVIIWFWDYGYSLNIQLVIYVLSCLIIHYFAVLSLTNKKVINYCTSRFLMCFDGLLCIIAFLGGIGMLCITENTYMQIVFTVAINVVILLSRVVACNYLKHMVGKA